MIKNMFEIEIIQANNFSLFPDAGFASITDFSEGSCSCSFGTRHHGNFMRLSPERSGVTDEYGTNG